jgi:hypothetical protein
LAPGGSVIVNVGHPEGSDRLEKVLTATMRESFDHVVRVPTQPTNTQLVGSGAVPESLPADRMPADLRPAARRVDRAIAPGLVGGEVYTDDRAPVEWLIDASILKVAADGG